jgi:hypothetical protein
MFQIIVITAVIVALSVLLLGINIFILGRKFPETEVGKNKHMVSLGIKCPHCEERARYGKKRPLKLHPAYLKPDWKRIRS